MFKLPNLSNLFQGVKNTAQNIVSGVKSAVSNIKLPDVSNLFTPKMASPIPKTGTTVPPTPTPDPFVQKGWVPNPTTGGYSWPEPSLPAQKVTLSPQPYTPQSPQPQYPVYKPSNPPPEMAPVIKNPTAPTITPAESQPTLFPAFNRPAPQPDISKLIVDAAKQNGVDPNVLAALLFQESQFRPTVIAGPPGNRDRGIAQINEVAHPEVTMAQALTPSFAIPFAANLLGQNLKYFKNDYNRAIAAYNVGRGGASVNGPTVYGGGPKGQFYLDNVVRNLTDELISQLGLKPSPNFR